MPHPASPADPAPIATPLTTVHHAMSGVATGDRKPAAQTVLTALLELERQRGRSGLVEAPPVGTWQLSFVSTGRPRVYAGRLQGRGWYVPQWLRAGLTIAAASCPDHSPAEAAPDQSAPAADFAIANQICLGLLRLQFSGPARFDSQRRQLAFDFTHWQFTVGQWTLGSGQLPPRSPAGFKATPLRQLPFFTFSAVTEQWMAARGRGGGLAIWRSVAQL